MPKIRNQSGVGMILAAISMIFVAFLVNLAVNNMFSPFHQLLLALLSIAIMFGVLYVILK